VSVRLVFVDSSAWVDYFGGTDSRAVTLLDGLLGRSEAVVGDLVLLEILQGYRLARDARTAEALLARLRCFTVGGEAMARAAAANHRQLRGLGVTPRSSIDVLIATFCIEHGLELLASDRDFSLMAPHLGLRLLGTAPH
jgi:predicted nucleic acid-binding protein